MNALLQFHALTAARGDGLPPEPVALFQSGETVSQTDLTIPDRSQSGTDNFVRQVPVPADISENGWQRPVSQMQEAAWLWNTDAR